MAKNEAYLKSSSIPESDECYTPRCAVVPMIKYLKQKNIEHVLCPFDKNESMFVRVLKSEGFKVECSHIETGQDFFQLDNNFIRNFDAIISNPPFSMKDKVLKKCYEAGIPFALLLPQNSLQSIKRVNMFSHYGLEYMGFDKRVPYYTINRMDKLLNGNHFASGYFCNGILPEKLIFENLPEIQEPFYSFCS